MTKFLLEIVNPERRVFQQEVTMVTLPTLDGKIGVLARHVPLFTQLVEGEIKITDREDEYYLAIGGGFMEVTGKKVTILVSRASHAHELNEAEIKKAQEAARQVIEKRAKGTELAQAQAIMRRAILELKVLQRHRKAKRGVAI